VVISWVTASCSPFRMNRRFGITSYPLELQKRRPIINGLQGVMYLKIQIFVFRVYLKVILNRLVNKSDIVVIVVLLKRICTVYLPQWAVLGYNIL
jgi:hypothetical protein